MVNSAHFRYPITPASDEVKANFASKVPPAERWRRIDANLAVGSEDAMGTVAVLLDAFQLSCGPALRAALLATPPTQDSTFQDAERWEALLAAARREVSEERSKAARAASPERVRRPTSPA